MPTVLPEHIGVDFGTHSIKVVYLKNAFRKPVLFNLGAVHTPAGVINSFDEDKKDQLSKALAQLVQELHLPSKYVVGALPESSVYSRMIDLPKMEDEEVQDAIYWEAKQHLPVSMEELRTGTLEINFNKATGERRMLLVAAPINLSDLYSEIIERAGLVPVALESEALSVLRVAERALPKGDAIVLDFGSQATDMSVMKKGFLYFSQSINMGGDILTKTLMNDFQITYAQAEEYKRTYGVLSDQAEGKIYNSLRVILDNILLEVRRGIEFFKSQTNEVAPGILLLTGDGALLPGIVAYIKQHLGIDVAIMNTWHDIRAKGQVAQVASEGQPAYSVAAGLCLKGS